MRQPSADQLQKLTADDQTIARSLEDASIPALVNALVHITGDTSLLKNYAAEAAKASNAPFAEGQDWLGDPQNGIPVADQTRIKARALEVLKQYRDQGCPALTSPSEATLQKMLDFIVGQEISPDYMNFLRSELALNGEDSYAQPNLLAQPASQREKIKVVIIGAGMSGLLAAVRMSEAGIPFTVIDKNADVGGTWFENVYPGCRVDSPNHTYSYSFRPFDWPQYYSEQEVLRKYFAGVADEFGLRKNIRFNTEVELVTFDESAQEWQVKIKTGGGQSEILRANAVISAVGQLNRPKMPTFPGQEKFKGPSWHSARWNRQVDLTGKRVAVIGTGASAFQFVPRIAEQAKDIKVFQRTPPWVSPSPTYQDNIPAGKHFLLNHVPFYAKWFRFLMFWRSSEGLLGSVRREASWNDNTRSISQANQQLRDQLTGYIAGIIGDRPELMAKVVPDYPPGGKRMLVDNGTWLTALRRDNVHIVTDPIKEVTEKGIRCESGTDHEFDVIIYGTGFHTNRILFPMQVVGRNGVRLEEQWETDNPRAYLGITVPNFPNLFLMYGPNTNIVVNGSIIFFSECEMRYILSCLSLLIEKNKKAMEPRLDVHDAYNRSVDVGNEEMAWGTPTVSSWYKNKRGRVTQNWPFTLLEYWEKTRNVNEEDYLFG